MRVTPAVRLSRRGLPMLLLALGLTGCGIRDVAPDPMQQARIHARAEEFLLRAAESEIDVVCCNAMEALVDVAPRSGLLAFRRALRSGSPLVRFAGCVSLGQVRDRQSLPMLEKLCQDPDPRVRLGAAFARVRCGELAPAEILVTALMNAPDENLRCDAALLIGKLEEPRALRRLRFAHREEQSYRVRTHLSAAMAALGDRESFEELVAFTQVDQVTRVIALQSLAELGNGEARDVLLHRLNRTEEHLEPRLLAARALGRIGSSEGYKLARENLTYTEKTPDERDPDRAMRIRSIAALALGAIGDPRALTPLETLAATETDARTQVAASFAICQIARRSAQLPRPPAGRVDRSAAPSR